MSAGGKSPFILLNQGEYEKTYEGVAYNNKFIPWIRVQTLIEIRGGSIAVYQRKKKRKQR